IRPLIVPQPVTTPSPAGRFFSIPKSVQRWVTNMSYSSKLPSSSNSSTRSRAVSLPRACCASMRFCPPPMRASARRVSNSCRISFMDHPFLPFARPYCGAARTHEKMSKFANHGKTSACYLQICKLYRYAASYGHSRRPCVAISNELHLKGPLPRPRHTAAYCHTDPARGAVGACDEHLSALPAQHDRLFRHRVPTDAAVGGGLSWRERGAANPDRADLGQARSPPGDPLGPWRVLPCHAGLHLCTRCLHLPCVSDGASGDRHRDGPVARRGARLRAARPGRVDDRLRDNGYGGGADDRPGLWRHSRRNVRLAVELLAALHPWPGHVLAFLGRPWRDRQRQRHVHDRAIRAIPRASDQPAFLGLCACRRHVLGRVLCLPGRCALCRH